MRAVDAGRLRQQTVYGDDPPAMAERWVSEGAQRIHTVDLEAAAAGHPVQLERNSAAS